jgi:hypothetical protein
MTDTPEPEFELELSLDATLSIKMPDGQFNWIKPGVKSKFKWKYIPTIEEIQEATEYLEKVIIEPTMDDVIQQSADRIAELNV